MILYLLEALGGTLIISLIAWMCWQEARLVAWEESRLLPLLRRIRKTIRRSAGKKGA